MMAGDTSAEIGRQEFLIRRRRHNIGMIKSSTLASAVCADSAGPNGARMWPNNLFKGRWRTEVGQPQRAQQTLAHKGGTTTGSRNTGATTQGSTTTTGTNTNAGMQPRELNHCTATRSPHACAMRVPHVVAPACAPKSA